MLVNQSKQGSNQGQEKIKLVLSVLSTAQSQLVCDEIKDLNKKYYCDIILTYQLVCCSLAENNTMTMENIHL